MHPAAVSLAIASLASCIMGALTVITELANRPINPVFFLVGGAALCGALWETVRMMTRPDRHRVTRAAFHAASRGRVLDASADPSADRATRTDQAAFLANPPPPVGRVHQYGTAPPAPPAAAATPPTAARVRYYAVAAGLPDPRTQAWQRRNSPTSGGTGQRDRLHALPHAVDPGLAGPARDPRHPADHPGAGPGHRRR